MLRRPPLGHVLQSAHDMGREHRIIDALRDTDVPVANALGLCEDVAVNGAPFYLMDFVEGAVLATFDDAEAFPEASRRPAADDLIDVMGRLHAVDPDAVGLGTLGRKEGYIARQLKRWHGQFTAVQDARAAAARRGPRPPGRRGCRRSAGPASCTATSASGT